MPTFVAKFTILTSVQWQASTFSNKQQLSPVINKDLAPDKDPDLDLDPGPNPDPNSGLGPGPDSDSDSIR